MMAGIGKQDSRLFNPAVEEDDYDDYDGAGAGPGPGEEQARGRVESDMSDEDDYED